MKKEFACFSHCFIESLSNCEAIEGKKLGHLPNGHNQGVPHFYRADTMPMKLVSKAFIRITPCMNVLKYA